MEPSAHSNNIVDPCQGSYFRFRGTRRLSFLPQSVKCAHARRSCTSVKRFLPRQESLKLIVLQVKRTPAAQVLTVPCPSLTRCNHLQPFQHPAHCACSWSNWSCSDQGEPRQQRAPASIRLSRSWSRAWFVKHITTIGPTSGLCPTLSTTAASTVPPSLSPPTPLSSAPPGSPKRGLGRRTARPAGFLRRARGGFAVRFSACLRVGGKFGYGQVFWESFWGPGCALQA